MTPSGSTQVTINRLLPGTLYEFQVIGKNALGDGMLSKVITVQTLGEFNILIIFVFFFLTLYKEKLPQPYICAHLF